MGTSPEISLSIHNDLSVSVSVCFRLSPSISESHDLPTIVYKLFERKDLTSERTKCPLGSAQSFSVVFFFFSQNKKIN